MGNNLMQSQEMKGVVTTGSISSTVVLDYDHGTAHKTYKPPLYVRLLYWIVFQAPFPYVANHAALEAARYRRSIVGLLTKFWYGEPVHDNGKFRIRVRDRYRKESTDVLTFSDLLLERRAIASVS